ncbi:hypothetical protein GGX14DRAFT_438704 [Mycena pura]|uniref:Peroxisomal targeting signal receptor n=1 Tax=Mycena pura TaxID=153505 RepID=A0AAD6YF05_9AGAR|nr:hypothetical protein GGX14DRAFT_438704 [Mycena pura]
MALPMLVNNADCGPSNPLQSLSKRFDQDRGLQQTFRSQQPVASGVVQEAARFFSPQPAPQLTGAAFDLSALHGSLPQPQLASSSFQQQQAHAAWASDFLQQQPILMQKANNAQMQREINSAVVSSPQPHETVWDREFSSRENLLATGPAAQAQDQSIQGASQDTRESDELARTAGLLLETVRDAQNPKFNNSEFMTLMRGLRDRDIIVEGNNMVKNTDQSAVSGWASDFQSDIKGKGRAVDVPSEPATDRAVGFASMVQARLAEQQQSREGIAEEEDPNDAYFRQENAEYQYYWAEANAPPEASTSRLRASDSEWDHLQADWDLFEATNSGIKPVDQYIFQRNNPYLSDRPSSTTRHHLAHLGREPSLESVLELEAAVQRKMSDASAWYDLGVKQQANERERQALQALTRAVELDPTHLHAWIALAISHTNNGDRAATHHAIGHWVDGNERYRDAVAQFRALNPEGVDTPMQERFANLIRCLITMARNDITGTVDADIQIALAILLNSKEDYEKAQDCFRTALAVRPDDWLLYNRVGATMANSGRAEEALQYYHKALELNPLYIRARSRFEEAIHHILNALSLQESDAVSQRDNITQGGVTTTALWDSLRTASISLQRPDLATFCDQQNLEGFRRSFQAES